MDWKTLYCPNQRCRYYGLPFSQGRLVRNGSSHGQQQALCKGCGSSVSLRYGTTYYDLKAEPAIFETAVRLWPKEIHFAVQAGLLKLIKIRPVTG
jgi:transposase-like protein